MQQFFLLGVILFTCLILAEIKSGFSSLMKLLNNHWFILMNTLLMQYREVDLVILPFIQMDSMHIAWKNSVEWFLYMPIMMEGLMISSGFLRTASHVISIGVQISTFLPMESFSMLLIE